MFCEPKTNRKKGTAYNMVLAKDGAELLIELSVIFSRKILFVSHFLFNLVPRKSILLIFVIIETLVLLIPSFSQYLFRYTKFYSKHCAKSSLKNWMIKGLKFLCFFSIGKQGFLCWVKLCKETLLKVSLSRRRLAKSLMKLRKKR